MRQKQAEALANAGSLSGKIKDKTFRVLDKPHKPTVITCDYDEYKRKISDGYITIAVYKGGARI